MPKYLIQLAREMTADFAEITIEADSRSLAENMALADARQGKTVGWTKGTAAKDIYVIDCVEAIGGIGDVSHRVLVDYKDPRAGCWKGPKEDFLAATQRYGIECVRIAKGGIKGVYIERLSDGIIVASATS